MTVWVRVRRQRVFPLFTKLTVSRCTTFCRNRYPLFSGPPGPGFSQLLPIFAVCCTQVMSDGDRAILIIKMVHAMIVTDSRSFEYDPSLMNQGWTGKQLMSDISDVNERKKRDNARLRKVATNHSIWVLASLTIWGVSDHWAAGSGLLLASAVALLNAVFVGVILASIAHEWGHFSGARLSGAISPIAKEPSGFFMFSFKDELNTRGQFLAMSLGGPIANWSLVIALFFLLPLATWSQALLLAATFSIAVSVSVFEVPVINRVMYGDDPTESVQRRLQEAGNTPRFTGIAAGAVIWLLAV